MFKPGDVVRYNSATLDLSYHYLYSVVLNVNKYNFQMLDFYKNTKINDEWTEMDYYGKYASYTIYSPAMSAHE